MSANSAPPAILPQDGDLKRYWQEQRLDLIARFDEGTGKLNRLDIVKDDITLCIFQHSFENGFEEWIEYAIPDGVHSMHDLTPRASDIEHYAYSLFIENLLLADHPHLRNRRRTVFRKFPG